MTNNNIVTKSNSLIEARYKLTLEEQRVILYLVSMVQPKDEDFKIYTISVKDFLELVNIKNQNIYTQFKDISEQLMSKPLVIKKDNSTLVMNWLSSAEYYSGQGKIELSFDPKLKPYLLKLKANFTSYKLQNVIMLKSFYSIRIYELLKQYERLKERLFTLKDLREYLCIDENLYPMYSNFKQKVLNVAYKELKEKSDVFFEYEEIKPYRKVEKIRFIIHTKSDSGSEENTELKEAEPLRKAIESSGALDTLRHIITQPVSNNDLITIYEAANGNIELIKSRYEEAKTKRLLDNFVGFMVWACREPDESFNKIVSRAKGKFNNYEGRKLDFSELEMLERELLVKGLSGAKRGQV